MGFLTKFASVCILDNVGSKNSSSNLETPFAG